jgi:hypothetical protein
MKLRLFEVLTSDGCQYFIQADTFPDACARWMRSSESKEEEPKAIIDAGWIVAPLADMKGVSYGIERGV